MRFEQGSNKGEVAAIGTALQIQRHHRMDDGRMAIENIGAASSRVLYVMQLQTTCICARISHDLCGGVLQAWTGSR